MSVHQVIEALPREPGDEPRDSKWDRGLEKLLEKADKRSDTGVNVRGIPNILVRFAKCCNPVHGEDIVGFITRGRGVTVHAKKCPKVQEAKRNERWIETQWDEATSVLQRATIRVVGEDHPGLLAGISKSIAAADVNISHARIWTTKDRQGVANFEVMVRSLDHLKEVIHSIEKVKGVLTVERMLH
jgi:GTP pyrophosphokinase